MPANHPLAAKVPGTDLTYNDVFRAVHDYFGHAKEGNGFGPKGEEAAWRQHVQMYSPEARPAMSAETRGQNSWVNYGPHSEANRANPQNTKYAEQKATVMPADLMQTEDGGVDFLPAFPPKNYPETEYGYWISPDGKATAVPNESHEEVARSAFKADTMSDALARGFIRVVAIPNQQEVSVELSEDANTAAIKPFVAAALAHRKHVMVDVWGSGDTLDLIRPSDLSKLDKIGGESSMSEKPNFLPYGHWIDPNGNVEDVSRDEGGHAETARIVLGKPSLDDSAATHGDSGPLC